MGWQGERSSGEAGEIRKGTDSGREKREKEHAECEETRQGVGDEEGGGTTSEGEFDEGAGLARGDKNNTERERQEAGIRKWRDGRERGGGFLEYTSESAAKVVEAWSSVNEQAWK